MRQKGLFLPFLCASAVGNEANSNVVGKVDRLFLEKLFQIHLVYGIIFLFRTGNGRMAVHIRQGGSPVQD